MPAEIRYKNSVIATVAAGESKFLDCYGEKMASNVVVTLPKGYVIPKGSLSITANGTYDVTDKASVAVNVPIPDGYIKPSGTLSIAENGTHDVSGYSEAAVSVERPQLNAPTINLDGNTLTIEENVDNGAFTISYDLYIDGSLVGNYTSTTIDLTTLELAVGTYSITVKAKGTNFVDSAESEAVSYEVVA